MKEIKRGEIYAVDFGTGFGSEQGGTHPSLILQNDIGNRYSPTTIVAAITGRKTKALKRIFAAYLDGSSMLTIAEQLNREEIEYRDGVTGWNKGRLKHLIDNTKYLGTEVYPPIIDQATYEKIQKTKHGRNTQKNTDKTQDIFKLTVPVRCPSCGRTECAADTTADANAESVGLVKTRPAVCGSRYPMPNC